MEWGGNGREWTNKWNGMEWNGWNGPFVNIGMEWNGRNGTARARDCGKALLLPIGLLRAMVEVEQVVELSGRSIEVSDYRAGNDAG